jgi:soluble lytic murein transglycosylase-like protein
MPKRKNTRKKGIIARTVGVGAIAVGLFTGSVRHYNSEMRALKNEKAAFEQRRETSNNLHQKRLDEIRRKRELAFEQDKIRTLKERKENSIFNTKSKSKELSSRSRLSYNEIREYLLKNQRSLATKYRPISSSEMLHNKRILEPVVRNIARKYRVDGDLMVKLIQNESRWDPYAVGRSGDIGLGQLTPVIWDSKTHTEYNCNPLNPRENIEVSIKYYADLKKKFGDDRLALTAYNSGEGVVRNKLRRGLLVDQIVLANPNQYAIRVLGQKI